MAWALIGSNKAHAGGDADGFTSGTFDSTGADTLFVILGEQGAGADTGVVSDNKGNTFVEDVDAFDTHACSIWRASSITAGTGHTITCTGTDNFPSMTWAWYSGGDAAPFDQSGTEAGLGITAAPGPITPTTDNQLVIAGLGGANASANAMTINGGFTVLQSVVDTSFGHGQTAMAHLIQTTIAAADPTITPGDTGLMFRGTLIASYKSGAGGGGAPSYNLRRTGFGRSRMRARVR